MSIETENTELECDINQGCDAIELIIQPRETDLGEFKVKRTLPTRQRKMVGPWIFFDHMGPAEFAPEAPNNGRINRYEQEKKNSLFDFYLNYVKDLTGITPLAEAPGIWLSQGLWWQRIDSDGHGGGTAGAAEVAHWWRWPRWRCSGGPR